MSQPVATPAAPAQPTQTGPLKITAATTVTGATPFVPSVPDSSLGNGPIKKLQPKFEAAIDVVPPTYRGHGASGGWSSLPPAPNQATTGSSVPTPKFADKDTANIAAADPRLQKGFQDIQTHLAGVFPGWSLQLTSVARTRDTQAKIPSKYTNADGAVHISRHNYSPSLAFDVDLISPTGKALSRMRDQMSNTDWESLWEKFGQIVESNGLVWGGRWKKPYDPYHVQLKEPAPFSPKERIDSGR